MLTDELGGLWYGADYLWVPLFDELLSDPRIEYIQPSARFGSRKFRNVETKKIELFTSCPGAVSHTRIEKDQKRGVVSGGKRRGKAFMRYQRTKA